MTEAELKALVEKSVAAFDALSSAQQTIHRYEQRRSFVRGQCPTNRDYHEWRRSVDRLLPPVDGLPEEQALAIIARTLA